jgi:hypothetical protein
VIGAEYWGLGAEVAEKHADSKLLSGLGTEKKYQRACQNILGCWKERPPDTKNCLLFCFPQNKEKPRPPPRQRRKLFSLKSLLSLIFNYLF